MTFTTFVFMNICINEIPHSSFRILIKSFLQFLCLAAANIGKHDIHRFHKIHYYYFFIKKKNIVI